ncbi:MAG: peptidylprolyl isomerase [Clostridia bacterium]|nr:peptidylprolyl isomerase [Clostridia bacterium]
MEGMKTAAQELQEIQQALTNVALGGQSYTIGSRKLTRAEYSQLLARQKELQAQLAAEQATGLFDDTYVAVFDGR